MISKFGQWTVGLIGLWWTSADVASAQRIVTADVVALDQAFYNNRLGAFQAGGMMFALRRDVVSNVNPADHTNLAAGQVMLRPDKRPRPIVLRINVGDCLDVKFENLLASVPSLSNIPPGAFNPANLKTIADGNSEASQTSQPSTRLAGVHVMGMGPKDKIGDDASWIGGNSNGLAAPGEKKEYKICPKAEGAYLLYSSAANIGNADGFGGQLTQGLFGTVMVEPKSAEWYRSQVTRADLDLATYTAGQLPANMSIAPKGNPQQTFTSGGKTYKLWTLTRTGAGSFTAEVTQTNLAGDPVGQNGLLKTRDLHPVINYQATYPDATPILAMLNKNTEIVHSDLTAIITGPNAGRFPANDPDPVFTPNPTYPNRREPFREFAIHYHDDPVVTQAFPEFNSLDTLETPGCQAANTCGVTFALQSARDFFAINYGIASIGPEVWANRLNVGPMSQCATCKFEEFFLSSWAVSDPAMVVDFPANSKQKATKALFPDDPSNVYHSYIGDHVQFRILHAGTNITHVHHQHAHQWLHSPNSDDSDYRDSQMISPGGSYTLDMSYFGSGNLNQTVGDSIFHCHFYPHFAQGMWSLWRTHDVFEAGTNLDANGVPVTDWNRALPDGEIAAGTPIPAVVPMPTIPMAPMPINTRICPVFGAADYVQFIGDSCPPPPPDAKPAGYRALVSKTDVNDPGLKEKNPGFPFFVPGVAGQRPPHPPLDLAPEEDASGNQVVVAGKKQYLDGGLPRAQFLKEEGTVYEQHNAWDFSKENDKLLGVEVDQEGTSVEKIAMAAHAVRDHPSFTPSGQPGPFLLNGQSPKPGAPFADPAVDIFGKPIPNSDCANKQDGCVRYKAADIELDVVFNKKGWHYPQQRILSLWGDIKDNLEGTKRPEPLFFRANSGSVIEYWLTNLVPAYYELDDFQVRTPTDIIGQHIHLVKFDVTSSDGAGNGYNYEDGTFSYQEVQSLIKHVNYPNNDGGLFSIDGTQRTLLKPKGIPYLQTQFGPTRFLGAQATVQRWYADPILNCKKPLMPGVAPLPCVTGEDRTMRTVFTHDHFGPSTHQQVGLYAGLVVEPAKSKWFDSQSGLELGKRFDGGPTTYSANINLPVPANSYREFLIEFQDRQLAYLNTSITQPKPYVPYGPTVPGRPNPNGPWGWVDNANAINPPESQQLNLIPGNPPTPDLVTNQSFEGAFSLNYSNEPLPYRVSGATADQKTDLAHAFRSIARNDKALNCQPVAFSLINPGGPLNCPGVAVAPATPGFKFAPPQKGAEPNDPYTPLLRVYEGENVQIRNLVGAHMMPHSYHIHGLNWLFEPSVKNSGFRSTQGMGISEHYEFLFRLPVTSKPRADYLYISTSDASGLEYGNWGLIRGYDSKQRQADLVPLRDTQKVAFPQGGSIPRAGAPAKNCPATAHLTSFQITAVHAADALNNPLGVIYNSRGSATTGSIKTDPDALMYVLSGDLDASRHLKPGVPVEPLILRAAAGDCITIELTNALGPNVKNSSDEPKPFSGITLNTSQDIGLHPQLLHYDVTSDDGFNIGSNPISTVAPTKSGKFTWYAGRVEHDAWGNPRYIPVEFGAVSLAPADPLMQHTYGLIGALIIEPPNFIALTDKGTRAAATINVNGAFAFREGVIIAQDDLNNVPPAVNYRTEPFSYRFANQDFIVNSSNLPPPGIGMARSQSDTLVAADPQTPIFLAEAGKALRLRVVHPAGSFEQVFELHGHSWQEEPYATNSTTITANNPLSQWTGSRDTFGPNASFDVILPSAGGVNGVPGDYLFRTFIGADFQDGLWGIIRVGGPGKDVVTVTTSCNLNGIFTVEGINTVSPVTHDFAATVTITGAGLSIPPVAVDQTKGTWKSTSPSIPNLPATITVTSSAGGSTAVATTLCPVQAPPPPPLLSARRDVSRTPARNLKDLIRFRPAPKKTTSK